MIERNEAEGYTAAYLTADWDPTDAESAAIVKIVYDDGRVMFLTDPAQADDTSDPEPADEIDDVEHHEHNGVAWDRHRRAPRPLKIMGHSLATWARGIHAQDTQRIATAISIGLTAGDSNTDIAHRVIGSRRMNGVDGVTEITRQHILRLGHGLLKKRKTRMAGHSSDV